MHTDPTLGYPAFMLFGYWCDVTDTNACMLCMLCVLAIGMHVCCFITTLIAYVMVKMSDVMAWWQYMDVVQVKY